MRDFQKFPDKCFPVVAALPRSDKTVQLLRRFLFRTFGHPFHRKRKAGQLLQFSKAFLNLIEIRHIWLRLPYKGEKTSCLYYTKPPRHDKLSQKCP